ncbi:deoxyhypusine synthase [Halocatena halophila]|uniref:deoxyhypusine synthase n=1 Tax=Halocatena halophila TaxID=2814576 RepID=UPI002ED0B174
MSEEVDRTEFQHDPIDHARVTGEMSVGALLEQFGKAGIGAADLHEATDVAASMFEEDTTVFFGLAGAMVPTGMRQIVADLICDGYIDVLVTTGANLTHDAIEAIGGKHHHGRVHGEGTEREHDETLRDEGVDRIYNVYLPQEHFALFETHLREEVFPAFDEPVSIRAFTRKLGKANATVNERENIEEAPGIAAVAAEHDVPIYVPAIQDSVLGLQAWLRSQVDPFSLDALSDMSELNDIAYEADSTGAFVVGGGVPKNYVLQTMLVTPGAYDYGVQLTMDPPQTGGLSGATLDEARSWGKLKKDARNVSVYADATITLPLVIAGARERIE